MATVEYENLDFCVDCTMEIANGDLSALSDEEAEAHIEAMDARWAGTGLHLVITCNGDAEDCDEFSTSQCDGCGTYLAGVRHKGAALA